MTPRLARQPGERTRLRWGTHLEARLLLGHCSPRHVCTGRFLGHLGSGRQIILKALVPVTSRETLVEMAGTLHRMSHSLHGECDIEPERANETASFERPAGGADYVGSGGRVDGSELTPRSTHAGGLPGSGCSFPRPWPPWPPTSQRHIRGGDRRTWCIWPALDTRESTIPI